jgi:hypothetical protein
LFSKSYPPSQFILILFVENTFLIIKIITPFLKIVIESKKDLYITLANYVKGLALW